MNFFLSVQVLKNTLGSDMKVSQLTDRKQAIPIIARWYFDEWGHLSPDKAENDIL